MQLFREKCYIGVSFHRSSDLNGLTDLPQLKLPLCSFFIFMLLGFIGFFHLGSW